MSKKTVTRQSFVPIWEKKNLEAHYSQMAADGYFVSDKTMLYEEYIQKEGEKRRYAVILHRNLVDEELEVLRQSGWEKSFWSDDCLVLSTNQEDSPLPFEDDIEAWSTYLQKMEMESKGFGIGIAISMFMLIWGIVRSSDGFFVFLLWLSGYLLFWAVKCFMKYDRAKKVRQDIFWGKKDSRGWQGVKRKNQRFWAVFFMYMIAQIIYYI